MTIPLYEVKIFQWPSDYQNYVKTIERDKIVSLVVMGNQLILTLELVWDDA